MAKSDGSIIIDTRINTGGFTKGSTDLKNQFSGMAKQSKQAAAQIQEAMSSGFSKSVEIAKLKVQSLEAQLAAVSQQLKEALIADDDKSAERLGRQQEQVYDRLVEARRKLEIEVASAAQRQAEAEERAAEKTSSANQKANAASKKLSASTSSSSRNMSKMEKSADRFGRRLSSIVSGALFFNIVSSALSKLSGEIWETISSTSEMRSALNNLKGAAATAASPLVSVLSSAFSTVANAIATALSYLTKFYALLTGKSLSSLSDTAEEMGNVASAAGSAAANADAAQKSLAGFDEIQSLQDKDSGGGGGGGGSTPNYDYGLDEETPAGLVSVAEKIQELIAPLKDIDLSNVTESLERLGKSLSNFGAIVADKLEWVWFNVLVPLGEWAMEEAAPAVIDLLSAAFDALGAIIEAVWPFLQALWENFLEPIAEWTGDALIFGLGLLTTALQTLADSFDRTAKDANVLTEEEKNLMDASLKAADAFNKQQKTIEENEDVILRQMGRAEKLADELFTLADASGKVQEKDKARAEFIIKELNAALDTEIEMVGDVIKGYDKLKETIEKTIAAKKANLLLDANADHYTDALMALSDAWETMKSAQKDYNAQVKVAEEEIPKLESEIASLQEMIEESRFANDVNSVNSYELQKSLVKKELQDTKDLVSEKKTTLEKATRNYENYVQTISQYETASTLVLEENYDAASAILTGKAQAYGEYADSVGDATNLVISELEQEVHRTRIEAENTRKAFEAGVEGFTYEMVSEAEQGYKDALAAFESAKEDAKSAGNSFADGFISGLSKLGESVKSVIKNAITNATKNMSVATGISFSGSTFSPYSIDTANIPYLAKGTVIPPNAPFMAVLGDQRHGTNIEAPLATIQEAFRAEVGNMIGGMMAGFETSVAVQRQILEAILGIEIGDTTIGEAASRYNTQMNVIRGG